MTCANCGSKDWYELEDGRSRCSRCFNTVETPKKKAESEPAMPKPHGEGRVVVGAQGSVVAVVAPAEHDGIATVVAKLRVGLLGLVVVGLEAD